MTRTWPGNELYTFDWKTHEHPLQDHVFISIDDNEPEMLRYEEGSSFDPENPFDEEFLYNNRAYRGQSVSFDANGNAYFPMVCRNRGEHAGLTKGGVVLMRRSLNDTTWLPSSFRYVSDTISSRGLLEPDATVLNDGKILIVCRGSDTPTTAGRKWMTWSDDEGKTIHPVEELRYASGKRFYSPSSIHRFIRSTKTGTLYWIANITPDPPSRNSPRYPLYIGEIDEERMGVIESSLVEIDNRREGDSEVLQLSNFHVIEDRETLDFEIYLTRLVRSRDVEEQSHIYRYRFTPQ